MPAAPRRQTRETNKGKHPGEIQILADLEAAAEDPRARLKRRSAIEVAAAKKAQDDAQQAAVAAQQAAIQKVARIQHQKKHADDNDMTSPATLPPRFRTKGLAAVVPKAAGELLRYCSLSFLTTEESLVVNSNARWIPDALLSDNEDDSDVLAVGDEDRTDADEVQVDGQAICTGVQQPESTAVTAAFDNNQDGAHVANMSEPFRYLSLADDSSPHALQPSRRPSRRARSSQTKSTVLMSTRPLVIWRPLLLKLNLRS